MPERRDVNPRKAPELACPRCGAMLEWIYRPDSQGIHRRTRQRIKSKHRMAADDIEIDQTEQVDAFHARKKGTVYLHVCDYECPSCWAVVSKAQAVPFRGELPRDFYLPEPAAAKREAEAIKAGQSRFDLSVFDI